MMENTLKITNVLSDPTRYNIYQYLIKEHEEVNVNDIAKAFFIHPNVARLHLSKLEDIGMVVSYNLKSGKGGRPSRRYRLSDQVIELNFPHRDYKLLSSIALEAFMELGEPGKVALYQTGKKYGQKLMENQHNNLQPQSITIENKMRLLEDAGTLLGMYPSFSYNEEENVISFHINNCPFKEIASSNHTIICNMHQAFIKGMLEVLFENVQLQEVNNMFEGCENCTYIARI
jgi:predicted ArsR family transcriptional regulator|nr:helix-turn-helix domain-containing protein [Virgibacillus halodenitrificans]CDQ35504.1 iron-sulfur cluster biosynthesis transcriptional regulator SufR [Virgibacillus halodenitrificans]